LSGIPVYRLIKQKWAHCAFDGEGARRYGGRWNSKGKSCVYVARTESLAILEVLVHLQAQQILQHYSMFELSVPQEDIDYLNPADLPDCWRDEPAPPETAEIGDAWLDGNSGLALAVPSVIVPREWNVILNPRHSRYSAIISHARQLDFELDPRLLS